MKIHIVLVTKYRKPLLVTDIASSVKQIISDIATKKNYHIVSMGTDKDHIHILLKYDTTERVSDIVKTIKQITTYYMWNKHHNYFSKYYWKKKILWSDGYFACSIGEVASATIQKYIETQG